VENKEQAGNRSIWVKWGKYKRGKEDPMDLENCIKCKRLFYNISEVPICPECREELERRFEEVKEYIHENCTANITEVAEACKVELSQVQRWVKEKRLELAADTPIVVACEHCGAMIHTGRLCEKCEKAKREVIVGLSSSFRQSQTAAREQEKQISRNKNKMHYIRRKK